MKQAGDDMLYLSACAVNGIKPDPEYIAHINLEKLFQMCQYHSLTAIVCNALESVGVSDKKFMEVKAKAIRKNLLLDAERKKICGFLEQNGIWYMPLKGAVLKEMYPQLGMRQMSDNDILFDASCRDIVTDFMQKRGYHLKGDNGSHCDEWMKEPVYNFEMHLNLFVKNREGFYHYYENAKERLVRVDGKKYAYRFSDEDFYIYMTAHAYKHYSIGGTGLRSLLDYYVYLKQKEKKLDWNYIIRELKKLKISEFEMQIRETAQKAFLPNSELSETEQEMIGFMLFSGTYGTQTNAIKSRIRKMNVENRKSYLLKRLFPDIEFYRTYYPTAANYPILIPFAWCHRIIRGLTVRRKNFKNKLSTIIKIDEKEFSQ